MLKQVWKDFTGSMNQMLKSLGLADARRGKRRRPKVGEKEPSLGSLKPRAKKVSSKTKPRRAKLVAKPAAVSKKTKTGRKAKR
jgi:hypothetical protein